MTTAELTEAPTAAFFREPLLRALGRLTIHEPGSFSMERVLAEVYQDTGYTEDQFGVDIPTGSPRLRVVLQQTFHKNLKAHGLADTADRGMWLLTDAGCRAAAALLLGGGPATSEGGVGLAWTLGPQVNSYSDDAYIQGVAITSTPCFGEFSDRSDVCAQCTLSGACKAAVLQRIAATSVLLRTRAEAAAKAAAEAARKAAEPPPPTPVPAVDQDDIEAIIRAIDEHPVAGARQLATPVASVCAKCNAKIDKGELVMHVDKKGVYHIKCYEAGT